MNFDEILLARARVVADHLESKGIEHAFMGGIALNCWAVSAATYDLDLTVSVSPEHCSEVIDGLVEAGFHPPLTSWPDQIGSSSFRKVTVQFFEETRLFDVDVFLLATDYQREALERKRRIEVTEGQWYWVMLPEDLLIHKLIAWRHKDRGGIFRLLSIQRDLDWPYLRKWVDRFQLGERYRESLKEAGLEEPKG